VQSSEIRGNFFRLDLRRISIFVGYPDFDSGYRSYFRQEYKDQIDFGIDNKEPHWWIGPLPLSLE
jgi:hypothetical protein